MAVTGYKDCTLKQSVIETSFADQLIGDQVRGCERLLDALVNHKDMYVENSKRRLTQDEFHHKWDRDIPNAEILGRAVDTAIRGIIIEELPNPYRKIVERDRVDLFLKNTIKKNIDSDKLINSIKDKKECWEIGTKYFVDKCAQQTVEGEPTAFEGLGKILEHFECVSPPTGVGHHEKAHWNMQMDPQDFSKAWDKTREDTLGNLLRDSATF